MLRPKARLAIFLTAFIAVHRPAHAYVTSAQLEYSVDNHAFVALNGETVVERSPDHWPDFAVLSTSDGSLPLEYFKLNGENMLAVRAINTGKHMAMSYRLTVHHSNGDPVVIWGEPETTRFLHLTTGQRAPLGWERLDFDDSTWKEPVVLGPVSNFYWLPEPAFAGIFGQNAFVPHLSHRVDGTAGGDDHDLFRSRFRFPYTPARTTLAVNPSQVARSGKVAVRVIPGPDAADIGPFKLKVDLPVGLDLLQKPADAAYDPARRRLEWSLSAAKEVRYVRLPISSIVAAEGWVSPEQALQSQAAQVSRSHRNDFKDPPTWPGRSASFLPDLPACFKLASLPGTIAQDYPRILGVIFHSQLFSGASNGPRGEDVDLVLFNYSVRSDHGKALPVDVVVSRTGSSGLWYDGYYDATEDRAWTWADLGALKVYFSARSKLKADTAKLADAWVIVRCMQPAKVAPVFYAQVSSARCETLTLQAGISSQRFPTEVSDAYELKVNPQGCPSPTPVPRALPTARPTPVQAVAAVPGVPPTPRPTVGYSVADLGLGCLQSSPEPFKSGGVFVMFCLKRPARLTLEVFAAKGGDPLRRMDGGEFRAGNSQLFFNGMDGAGKPLKPGQYRYRLLATDGKASAWQESFFTKSSEKRR